MDDRLVLAFKERAGCEGGGKGILITTDKTFTLSTSHYEAICYEIYDSLMAVVGSDG